MKGLLDYKSPPLQELLNDDVQSALAEAGKLRSYSDGELIYSEGDDATDMLIIHSGGIRVGRLSSDGKEMTFAVLGPGHQLGLMGMMVGQREQTATSIDETQVSVISRESFDRILEQHPGLATQLLMVILGRYKAALQFIDDLKRLPISVHTAVILEQLLESSNNPHIIDWNQSDIALALGTSRVSVGKALKELESEGLIALRYAKVEISDHERLNQWIKFQRAKLTDD